MMSSYEPQNETALVCAAQKGDKQALARLLENHWAWLKGLVYNVLGGPEEMDDALQNICVLLIDKIETLREPERFRPWLAVLARRATLNWIQQQRRQPISWGDPAALQQKGGFSESTSQKVEQNELNERMFEAVKELPDKYREAFILKYMDDRSYAEIAEILDLPITTVQIRLVRARRMMHNRLTGKQTNKVPRT